MGFISAIGGTVQVGKAIWDYFWDKPSETEKQEATVDGVGTHVGTLKNDCVREACAQSANEQTSKIETELNAANAKLEEIKTNVGSIARRIGSDAPNQSVDTALSQKSQESCSSLMLLANIAIDVKRVADRYVGDGLSHSMNDPTFQNLLDTHWLNSTLNGIQNSTSRTADRLPIQMVNNYAPTNHFTIAGAQEPRAVADAIEERKMSDFARVTQHYGAMAV